ncbi:MAG: LamG domain-containing protein, partial [Myxococcota bacterium]
CDDDDPRIHPDGLGCPNPDSMVGWWRFESQAMGSVPNEIAGNGDATLVGDAALSASGAPFGDSLFLAQPDDAADLSAAAGAFAADGTMPESGTVEAWVRPDTPVCGMAQSCAPMIVYFGEAPPSGDGFGSEAETHIMMNETVDGFVWAAFMNSAEETCFVSGTPAVLDDWAHVALSWGPTQCSLYVDGGLVASQVKGALNPGVVSVQLGRPNAPDLRIYQGDIDEVMFFNEERTAAEIGEDCGCSP